jgi:hypothetical protein
MHIKKKEGFLKNYSAFKNSRGLSTIVVTLILIVLALVAVGAVWVVVNGLIKTNSDQANITGLILNLQITRVAAQGENLSVTVQRNPGKGQMSKIKFVISDGINSEVVTRNASIEELASQIFNFPLSQMSIANVKTVSIAPVFTSTGGEDTTGQIVDTFTVSGVGSNGEYYGTNNNTNNSTNPLTCIPDCAGTDTCINGVCVPENCVSNPAPTTCGTWTCGIRFNNCGEAVFCGTACPEGSTCSNGICTTPACIKDCTGRACGLDPICSESCGVCSGTDTCNTATGVCVPYNCVPDSASTTCGTWTCGTKVNNCGNQISCGANCSAGNICVSGTCTPVYPINTGIVEETWPGTSGLYFGSSNLSINQTYENYYAKFPGSAEIRCLIIAVSRLPIIGYPKSHIGFNFETQIHVNDYYQIWENSQKCNA